jgi:uncharacterized membrane protein YphA (DoxX/SURF4 family)
MPRFRQLPKAGPTGWHFRIARALNSRALNDPARLEQRLRDFVPKRRFKAMAYPTTNEITRTSGRGLSVTLWTIQILTAAAFLAAGASKLAGASMMVVEFEMIGLGQWFRYFTGLLEIAGAIALLPPRTAFYGAALLATVMVGAIIAHFAVLGISTAVPPLILLVLTGTIAYFRRTRA